MFGGKKFLGQNLCPGAFVANMHCYTKQRARHRSPFLQPPPPALGAVFGSPRAQGVSRAPQVTPPEVRSVCSFPDDEGGPGTAVRRWGLERRGLGPGTQKAVPHP